jgi:hypothetical protein
MKDIIRKVLREEIQKKYVRSNANMEKVIISYLNKQMVGTKRIVGDPEKFYGNLDEHWCKNGVVIARSVYYFNNDEDDDGPELHNFNEGHIVFSKQIVDDIKRLFSVRENYVLNVIAEWYDDNYTTKFGEETGHPEIEVSYCESYDFKGEICPGEVEIPENISKDEKIKFIKDNSNEYGEYWFDQAWSNDIDDAYKKVAYKLKKQNNPLSEMIKLDINVGDTVMGGKFKNKKVIVKTIGKNEKGDITINGKPLLRFRILKENNIHLRRRESMMKEKLDSIIQNRFTDEEFQFMPFEHFRLHISDYVGTEMANELNLTGDEKVTFRNQIIQYVRSNFYEYLKEVWDSKQLY